MSFRVSLDASFTRASSRNSSLVRSSHGDRADTGTLHYDTSFNEDQSECIVLERFRDSEALIEHAAKPAPGAPLADQLLVRTGEMARRQEEGNRKIFWAMARYLPALSGMSLV